MKISKREIFEYLFGYNNLLMKNAGVITASPAAQWPRGKSYKRTQQFQQNQPDLYLVLGHKIFPVHRRFMLLSSYICKKIVDNEKVATIQFQLEEDDFDLVLVFLYVREFCFERNFQIQKVLGIAKALEIEFLEQSIISDFDKNFEQYNFFDLHRIGIMYKIQWLIQRCEQELLELQYEQLNINRYDLMQAAQSTFEEVIRNHQRLKANKVITGLGEKDIRDAIEQYEKHNKCQLDVVSLTKVDHECFTISENIQTTRKFNLTKSFPPPLLSTLTDSDSMVSLNKKAMSFNGCNDQPTSEAAPFLPDLSINSRSSRSNQQEFNKMANVAIEKVFSFQGNERLANSANSQFQNEANQTKKNNNKINNDMDLQEKQIQKDYAINLNFSENHKQKGLLKPKEYVLNQLSETKIPELSKEFEF